MNIKNLFPVSHVRMRYEKSSAMPKISPSRSPARPALRIVHDDRVVLSGSARALLDEIRKEPGVGTGLRAQLDATSLPDTRATEVLGRIQRGYYSRPEVQKEVASLLGSVLGRDSSPFAMGAI